MVKSIFLNDKIILAFILLNTICLFLQGFSDLDSLILNTAIIIDHFITVVFIIEMLVKISSYGWKEYIASGWNKLDFTLVMLSIPSLLLLFLQFDLFDLSILMVFRLLRALRFLRLLKYIHGIEGLIKGSVRALKTSGLIFIVFTIALLITTLFSSFLFSHISPEHFGDPLKSMYSIFKIFTIEGWFDIPDEIAEDYGGGMLVLVRLYFIAILFIGGIIGLSLLNSIFVDAMVSDNNDELEKKVDELKNTIDELKSTLEKSINLKKE